MNWCTFLWGNSCKAIETFYHWDSRRISHFAAWKNSETDSVVIFARLLISWKKLQVSPLEHCPLAVHCQQSPGVLCSWCFVSWFLTMALLSLFLFLVSKFSNRKICAIPLFHHRLQSAIIRSGFLLMNLKVVQFQYGLEFLRPSYSLSEQSFQDVIRWDFRHW